MTTYRFPHYTIFMRFIEERHAIYQRRYEKEQSPPWTKDEILAKYRFCNVYRELDRVTMWITKHWRVPHAKDIDVWLLMLIARLVNWPDTLAEMDFIGADGVEWKKSHFLKVMRERAKEGKAYGGAYIISTNGSTKEKALYLAEEVIDPMWKSREWARPKKGEALSSYHSRLMQFNGMGSFMAAQILADLKYVQPLVSAEDWWTFAASGPGSRRGLNYVLGHDPVSPWKEHEWRDALSELKILVDRDVLPRGLDPIHAQDLQNCLCEFSKYRRTQLGTGRPKSKFTPHEG